MPAPYANCLLDSVSTITGGMNSGLAPRLLPASQLAFAVNITNRGGLPRTRPVLRKVALAYADDTTRTNATQALFQDAHAYQALTGESSLVASIGGRLFRYLVGSGGAVQDISLSGDLNDSTNPNAWMWQAEDFLLVNNGAAPPLIFDGASVRRSKGAAGGELPAGCMGTYVQGRIWMTLPNSDQQPGQSYLAGDLVFTHGFTDGYGGRAAILRTDEANQFQGGAPFSVPVSAGPITGMGTTAVMDTSLGQGSLVVMTLSSVFSVNVPLDRSTWFASSNPLVVVSLPNYGTVSQGALVTVNGDLWYRSLDGIRSYQVGRRDMGSWVNTPLSFEMKRVLDLDTLGMLGNASGVLFDNRLLVACSPFNVNGRGVAYRGLVALDFHNISGLTADLGGTTTFGGVRSTPAYDGLWTGLSILKVLKGVFNGAERCFVFALDATGDICLYELMRDNIGMFDFNGTSDVAVESSFETRAMQFADRGNSLKKLITDDLYLDKLGGTPNVAFAFQYRSDEDPTWTDWYSFTLCAPMKDCTTARCPTFQDVLPQYRTYLRLPEPSEADCSAITRRQKRTGYEFQQRVVITGFWQLNRLLTWALPKSDSVVSACPTSENCTVLAACGVNPFTYNIES